MQCVRYHVSLKRFIKISLKICKWYVVYIPGMRRGMLVYMCLCAIKLQENILSSRGMQPRIVKTGGTEAESIA